jgi:CRISPR-associated protein Cmx8
VTGMAEESMPRGMLATRIQAMVRQYVIRRTESRTGLEYDKLPRTKDEQGRTRVLYPEAWREAQPKVVQEAFLQMRARRQHRDFVEYFAGTICSVDQRLPTAEYQELTRALLADGDDGQAAPWEDIRALAMIAISTMASVGRADEARAS